MTEVRPSIYLGALEEAVNPDFLDKRLITGIVTCCNDPEFDVSGSVSRQANKYIDCLQNPETNRVEQFRISVEDIGSEPILRDLDAVVSFINRHRYDGGGILIHCRSGISRSPTVLIAYLMVVDVSNNLPDPFSSPLTIGIQGISLKDAFQLLIQLRPSICPNVGFMEQLVKLERHLLGLVEDEVVGQKQKDGREYGGEKQCAGNFDRPKCKKSSTLSMAKYIDWFGASGDKRAKTPRLTP